MQKVVMIARPFNRGQQRIYLKMRYNNRVDIYYRFYIIYNLSIFISGNITPHQKKIEFYLINVIHFHVLVL